MSYRSYIKGLKRRKLTLGMFTGLKDVRPISQLPVSKYEIHYVVNTNRFFHVFVTGTRNREDMLVELLKMAIDRQNSYNSVINYWIYVTEYGKEKELLIDSRTHQDFILFLTDSKPKQYA